MRVGLPLLADLQLEQVDICAAANLSDVDIPGVATLPKAFTWYRINEGHVRQSDDAAIKEAKRNGLLCVVFRITK